MDEADSGSSPVGINKRRNDCIWADPIYLLTPALFLWIFRVLPDLGFVESVDSSGESLP